MKATSNAYSLAKNNLLHGMIFVMLLRCDIRKMLTIGPRMLAIFFSRSLTIIASFVAAFALCKGRISGKSWCALGALCGSWIGGSTIMAALQVALEVPAGDYACVLIVDTVYCSLWIALLLMAVSLELKWDKFCHACKATFEEAEEAKVASESSGMSEVSGASLTILLGLSLMASARSQILGKVTADGMASAIPALGDVFNASTCTMLIVTAGG